jgi:hypothetical protein
MGPNRLDNLSLLIQAAVTAAVFTFGCPAVGQDFDPFQPGEWPSVPLRSADPVSPAVDPFDQAPTSRAAASQAMPASAAVGKPIHKLPPTTEYPVKSTAYTYQPMMLPSPQATPTIASTRPSPLDAGCGTPNEKPLAQLSIQVQMPKGEIPADRAAACWQGLNTAGGASASARYWARQTYVWDATCMAHRPLYFEEINLERYGYGCHDCLQPFASAAHFFATVPALPYCMAADCPGECQYTLGHYRPGSCPPWRCHRPPISTRGGISEAGVLTGLIFLIP